MFTNHNLFYLFPGCLSRAPRTIKSWFLHNRRGTHKSFCCFLFVFLYVAQLNLLKQADNRTAKCSPSEELCLRDTRLFSLSVNLSRACSASFSSASLFFKGLTCLRLHLFRHKKTSWKKHIQREDGDNNCDACSYQCSPSRLRRWPAERSPEGHGDLVDEASFFPTCSGCIVFDPKQRNVEEKGPS